MPIPGRSSVWHDDEISSLGDRAWAVKSELTTSFFSKNYEITRFNKGIAFAHRIARYCL
jgi:hypothetical protein